MANSLQSDVVPNNNKPVITKGSQQSYVTCISVEGQTFHSCQSKQRSHNDAGVVGDEWRQTHHPAADQSLLQIKDMNEQQLQEGDQEDDYVNSTGQSSLQSSGPEKQHNEEPLGDDDIVDTNITDNSASSTSGDVSTIYGGR